MKTIESNIHEYQKQKFDQYFSKDKVQKMKEAINKDKEVNLFSMFNEESICPVTPTETPLKN